MFVLLIDTIIQINMCFVRTHMHTQTQTAHNKQLLNGRKWRGKFPDRKKVVQDSFRLFIRPGFLSQFTIQCFLGFSLMVEASFFSRLVSDSFSNDENVSPPIFEVYQFRSFASWSISKPRTPAGR